MAAVLSYANHTKRTHPTKLCEESKDTRLIPLDCESWFPI